MLIEDGLENQYSKFKKEVRLLESTKCLYLSRQSSYN